MSNEVFIDTNFFLRFFLKDIKKQYLEAKGTFSVGARYESDLRTSLIVVFEVFWVLSSFYKFNREGIEGVIRGILGMTFIKLEERDILYDALLLYSKTSLSLGDCYNLAYSRKIGVKEFKTFDVKLDKLAKALLEKETLQSEEFKKIVGKKKSA